MDIIKIILVTISLSKAVMSFAQNDHVMVMKGNEHYKKAEYDQAEEAYKKAAEANNKNVKAQYNLGNTLYKKKKLDDAAKAFDGVAEGATDKTFKAHALYNKGVAYTRNKQLMESIDAYKRSLRVSPADQDVRENLQLALNEVKKQQNNKDQNQQNQNQKKPEPKNQNKLSKQQVEKMLNALREEEKRLQQNKQQKTKAGSAQDKDW